MELIIKEEHKFRYVEEGEGPVLLLLHGLFGALSNWADVVDQFKDKFKVVIPLMPIYGLPLLNTNVTFLERYISEFIHLKNYKNITLIGNSLGGHVALIHVTKNPERIKQLVLTGSSGLYENAMGSTFPRREDYNFIKNKVELTFYDPKVATKELVDEVFEIINNKAKVIRILALAKSAIRHNMADELPNITMPTCLIWGRNDTVTPPNVAEEFHQLIPNTDLFYIDECGHAPMMESPAKFNTILERWLTEKNVFANN